MKRLAGWIVALVVVAGGVFAFLWYRKTHQKVEPKYHTVKVDRGAITAKVTATGTLSARVTVQVGTQVSGRLQDIFVDFNSEVKKGQVIAKIDPRLFDAALKKSRANLIEAQGQLSKSKIAVEQADRVYQRDVTLHDQGLLGVADLEIAKSALDGAKADVTVSQGNVMQASADLNQAEVNLGFTTIISPIDGTVISRNVDVGQTVAASLSAPVLFTIAQDLRVIQLDTFVAEADVGKLRDGMDTTFSVDAYPGQRFKGKVRLIRNAAQTVQNVVTYDAVIDVANDELKLKPGMTANVTFIWSEKSDALRIPNAGLRFRPPPEVAGSTTPPPKAKGSSGVGGGKPDETPKRTIWVLRNDQPVSVSIEVGISDGTMTEVVSGELKEGDDLITELTSTDGSGKPAASGTGGLRRVF